MTAPIRHDPDPVTAGKAIALRFQSAVWLRQAGTVQRLTKGMSKEQVIGLAVVLAEGYGQDATRLRLVTLASDEEAGAA